MLRPRLMAALLALALAGGSAARAQSAEPPEVELLRRELIQGCLARSGQAPSFGPDFLRRANLSPDGVPDLVVDVAAMSCPGAAGAFCRGAACPVQVFVSVPGGYRRVFDGFVEGVALRPGADRDVVVLGHRAMTWDGDRFVPVAMAAPPAAPPSPPPVAARAVPPVPGAWRLESRARATAIGEGVGQLRQLSFFCEGPFTPVVEAEFRTPMPARVEIALEAGGQRLAAPLLRQNPLEPVWRADAHGAPEIARLLAGAAGAVEVALDGFPQGAMGLEGAAAAIRSALARCLRLPAR
ncbi:MAG: hypothetical protein N3D18_11100 [Roseococcus sp.]|nr:hypothetical protein [Roseococcus sp.]